MAFGLYTSTISGISQLSDTNRFYRVGLSGAYAPATTVDTTALGGGIVYIYRPTGDFVTEGRQVFVNAAFGKVLSPSEFGGSPTKDSTNAYSSIGISNGGGNVNILCADPLGWSSGGYGLCVRGPDNSVLFSTADSLLVVASVVTVSFSLADLGVTKSASFDPAPFSGVPYLHFTDLSAVLKVSATTGYLVGIQFWFTSNTAYSYKLVRKNNITYNGDFSAMPSTLTRTFTIGIVV